MMQFTENATSAMIKIRLAAVSSKLTRMVHIENARSDLAQFDKKDWECFCSLAVDLNNIEFNMLVAVGIKKPYRATLFKNRLEKWK